jgi:hypothetical protein
MVIWLCLSFLNTSTPKNLDSAVRAEDRGLPEFEQRNDIPGMAAELRAIQKDTNIKIHIGTWFFAGKHTSRSGTLLISTK